jgi:predicted permease
MGTLRFAIRSVARAPRLSLAAVCCVAVGAAATGAVATLVGATLLRPLPFPEAERLVRVWFEDGTDPRRGLSIPELRDLGTLRSFDRVLGTARSRIVALFDHGAERMRGEAVTAGYFETLGVQPGLGRLLGDEDHQAGAPPVAVLAHATWTTRYGGDATALGKTLRTERTVYTVVGVAPPGFGGTVEQDAVEFWAPVGHYEPASLRENRRSRPAWAIARLREGTTPEAATAELAALGRALAEQHPDVYARLRFRLEPMGENWRTGLRRSGILLGGAAALLLLVASINVAGLMVARVLDRRRELAVRAALGAGRRRLVAQVMLESLLLVATGGALGTLAGPAVLRAFLEMSPVAIPAYVDLRPDATALALAVGFLGVVGLLAGVAPALQGGRVGPAEALKEGGRGAVAGGAERRWGSLLVAGEVALTLVLLVAGGLLLRSWERLERTKLGYRTDGVARMAITVSAQDARDAAALGAFEERIRAAVAGTPGVAAVGLVHPTLPPYDAYRPRVRFPGLDPARSEEGLAVGGHLADPGLLPALGIPVLAGRNLEKSDGPRSDRVAVVSRALAERMGGLERALGREVVVVPEPDEPDMPAGAFRVVGVAENVAWDGLGEEDTGRYIRYREGDARGAGEAVYVPLAQYPQRLVSIGVLAHGEAAAVIEPVRRTLGQAAPTSAVHWTEPLADSLAAEYAPTRFYAVLVAAFSTSALLLTGVGLFALLSHGVSRRTGEIGVRMALGALPGHVVGLVLRSGLRPLLAGVVLGLAGAVAVARLVGSLLYGIPALDGASFIGATAALLLVALAAGLLPARRAVGIDPMRALRAE